MVIEVWLFSGIGAVLEKFVQSLFTIEFKYDGERAQVCCRPITLAECCPQIHLLPDGTIRIYSRNSEDHTPKYPDILKFLPQVCGALLVCAFSASCMCSSNLCEDVWGRYEIVHN